MSAQNIDREARSSIREARPDDLSPEQKLRAENAELRARLDEAEETLRAIRCGEVDAIVVQGADGPQMFTLQGLDAESNRFRGEILAQVSEAVLAVDGEQRVTYLNAAAERQYGVTASEVLGRSLSEVYEYRWLRPEDEAAALAALRQHGRWRGENIHVKRTGETIHVESSVSSLPAREGLAPGLLTVIRDVTERKEAERALRKSEERLRKIYEHAATGIAITDLQGRFEQANPAYCALLGYTQEELRKVTFSSLLHPDDREKNLKEIVRLHDEELPFFELENRYVRKDGAPVWVHKFVSLLRGEFGEPKHLVALVTDVTERRRAEEALREAKEAAEAANRSKDRFLAVLSHELRTPLTPVVMAVGMLEHDPELRADVREDMTMIKRNIELETKLIDDLLDLTRVTSGKLELHLEPLDLNEVVQQVCAICKSQVSERGVHLEVALEEKTGQVAADAARLQQVLWNVLKNAIKFTSQDGIIRVTTARLSPERWEIRVQDNGIGISAETLPRIFDAFEQGGDSITRKFGGLGLGLAICRALIEMHHGSIRAESAGPGFGSTFIIELPAATAALGGAISDTGDAQRGNPQRLRLLVVEDHADTARALGRLLREAGFEVIMASSVADAAMISDNRSFDVLVSDIGLPDGKGYEVMRRFRARQSAPGIAMSGYGMDEDVRHSHEAGFTEHLVKPIDMPQLIAAIHRVTDNRS